MSSWACCRALRSHVRPATTRPFSSGPRRPDRDLYPVERPPTEVPVARKTELLGEIRKAQETARAAEANSAASAASAQRAAAGARSASEKADAIFRKSVRK